MQGSMIDYRKYISDLRVHTYTWSGHSHAKVRNVSYCDSVDALSRYSG